MIVARLSMTRHRSSERGGKPARCHGSVSMWPLGAGGCSADVKLGNVLKRRILEPRPLVWRSSSSSWNRAVRCSW